MNRMARPLLMLMALFAACSATSGQEKKPSAKQEQAPDPAHFVRFFLAADPGADLQLDWKPTISLQWRNASRN